MARGAIFVAEILPAEPDLDYTSVGKSSLFAIALFFPGCFVVDIKGENMSTVIPFKATLASRYLARLHAQNPLIHCITNDVVQNFTANVLLAIGAAPAMVLAKEEVADFVPVANSLLINIGTIHAESAKSMLLAAQTAYQSATPWVLDPVAIGPVLTYRTQITQQLLVFKPRVIRGNASEILALAGEKSLSKGPDSQDSTESALAVAIQLAQKYQTVIAVTGEVDYVTDGKTTYAITGGDVALTRVTGAGCALSAMVAAFIGSSPDTLLATASACFMMSHAGELADKSRGMGSFAVSLLDHLSLMNASQLQDK